MIRQISLLALGTFGFCSLTLAQVQIAVVGGTLIDVRNGNLMPGSVIVIEADRIVSISTGGQIPAAATVVDAKGKYVLPGLIDAHVHYRDWAPELFLNYGVTSVLNVAGGWNWTQAQKAGIENGTIPGPRFFNSLQIEGQPVPRDALLKEHPLERVYINQIASSEWDYEIAPPDAGIQRLRNVAEAREAMKDYVSGKVKIDAIAPLHNLQAETLRAVVEEARKVNIPLIGHFENARLAADLGGSGVEHTWIVAAAVVDMQARGKALQKVTKGFLPPVETFIDFRKLPDLVQYMVKKGVYLSSTMRMTWSGSEALLKKGFQHEDFDLLFGDWRLRYVPLDWKLADMKEFFEIDLWNRDDLTPYDRELFEQGYKNAQRLIKTFVDGGGKLYAATDCASFCVPGLGMHQELELLVDAGITPLQALQGATIWPAEMMRTQDRLGTIEKGKAADILILDANPLENIRNTRKIAKVISRGRVLDGQYHPDFKNPVPVDRRDGSSHYFPSPRIRRAWLEGNKIMVQGKGFIPYSVVNLDGRKLKTEFIDEFQLKAAVPAELLKEGSFPVVVENPDFGAVAVGGTPDVSRLGILDHVSAVFPILIQTGDK